MTYSTLIPIFVGNYHIRDVSYDLIQHEDIITSSAILNNFDVPYLLISVKDIFSLKNKNISGLSSKNNKKMRY